MRAAAVQKAILELNRAERAAFVIQGEIRVPLVADNWWTFIRAVSDVWRALQIGAGRSGSSRDWINSKTAERDGDELLSYLHHARNSEEHGLEYSGGLRHPDPLAVARAMDQSNASPETSPEAVRASIELLFLTPRFALRPVSDRSGVTIPAPRIHLGQPIDGNPTPAPGHVVFLAITYLRKLVTGAEALVIV